MTRGLRLSAWSRTWRRQWAAMAHLAKAANARAGALAAKPKAEKKRAQALDTGLWAPGLAMGPAAARRFHLYRPPNIQPGERLPLLVMLHGCGQDAQAFAASTRMNSLARRERFLVLYPEQDRLAHSQGCWHWYGIDNGRAALEIASVMQAIDQVLRLPTVDGHQVAVAGFSAGACMAALLAQRHPERFKALVMHSGVAPGIAHSGLSALAAMRGQRSTSARATARGKAQDSARASAAPRWPPLLVIQGDADTVVSPANGLAAVERWTQATGAKAGPARALQRGKRRTMVVTDFKHAGLTSATLVAIQGLGHAWSGGAARQPFSDASGPDASRLLWAFVTRQFRALEAARADATPRRTRAASLAGRPPPTA